LHQPTFQTKIQPNSNLGQLAIQPQTRKLAKSPIKTSPSLNLAPTSGVVNSSPFQPVMQSIPQQKTPIYSTKAPLPTKQIPLNQNSLNNPMRQTSQPILMNTPNNYPMRSNSSLINQPQLHPHHNRQPNITQKFTLNPFSQVRKINYQGNQINTSPLLYKVDFSIF
jgi:hypothetical protein